MYQLMGELISEAFGVLIIVLFGDAASAMFFLYTPGPYQHAYWGVAIAWGLAVTFGIYTSSSVTGAHLNPAVTLGFALFRGFSWRRVPGYWIAQCFGGFVGAALVYALYQPVIDHFLVVHHAVRDGSSKAAIHAAGVFFTHPGSSVITTFHGFTDQIIETAGLVFGIFAITEKLNDAAPRANSGALLIGLLVAMIGASMGNLEAWAINPARDFGPRVFAWLAGWGSAAFPSPQDFWWPPIAGPLIGGGLGAAAYQWLIRPFLPRHQWVSFRTEPEERAGERESLDDEK